jgi:hypothetical protein
MLLKLLFMLFAAFIAYGLMLRQAEPIRFSIVQFTFNLGMIRARVNNGISITDEKVFFIWKF